MPDENGGTPPTQGDTPISPPERLPMPPTAAELREAGTATTPKDYERLWSSQRGEIKARQQQWDEWQGQMDTVVGQLRNQLAVLQGKLSAVQAERDNNAQQLEALPTLQTQASMAEALQAHNERLNQVLRYPGLLSQTQVETVEQDGQQVQTRINPFLDAALSSSLQGDAYSNLLAQLEARVVVTTPRSPPPASPLEMNVPNPPSPSPDVGSVVELKRQINEAYDAGNYQEVASLQEQLFKNPQYLEELSRSK